MDSRRVISLHDSNGCQKTRIGYFHKNNNMSYLENDLRWFTQFFIYIDSENSRISGDIEMVEFLKQLLNFLMNYDINIIIII